MKYEKIKIDGDFCLPTAEMKVCGWDNMTSFYLDEGQLHWPHGECETIPALYIEVSGDARVISAENREDALKLAITLCGGKQIHDRRKPWEWKQHKGTIIETRIPVKEADTFMEFNGAANFVAFRHPSHDVRVEMLTKLMETVDAQKNASRTNKTG
jgi:hypothetical protein